MQGHVSWEDFQTRYYDFPNLGLSIDLSRLDLPAEFLKSMEPRLATAFSEMAALEVGAIANADEGRMVGHYWLRNPSLAPTPAIRQEIESTNHAIKEFAARIHQGQLKGERGEFKNLLVIGIGGSALGPQFVASACGRPGADLMQPFFFDNTDPDGMDKVLASLKGCLGQTLAIVISKSGGTKETRNGMLEAAIAWKADGLDFSRHAVAITGADSELSKHASTGRWLAQFPMWDWVGGRTSETSAVGLLPALLQGIDVDALLHGAALADNATRQHHWEANPAALLALGWYHATNGKGEKDMVILPYKDRLELFSRYLQQLVMESLGKEKTRSGEVVCQGLAVYGNKGSTDQHAYIQQLREGVPNFFATFIQVLQDRQGKSAEVESGVTSGDFLTGFFLGTRTALYENGRKSITITIETVNERTVGLLIALYERTVGIYASLVDVNAYHQPGVEAGKKAAGSVIALQHKIVASISATPANAASIAKGLGSSEIELIFEICQHLAANGRLNQQGRGPSAEFSKT